MPSRKSLSKQQRIQAFFDPKRIYPTLQKKEAIEIKDEDMSQFYSCEKHFLIMTEAGKPIYSRFGDEDVLSTLFSTIIAVIHKYQSFFVKVQEGPEQANRMRWVTSGKFSCAVLKKGNIFYLCLVNSNALMKEGKTFIDSDY